MPHLALDLPTTNWCATRTIVDPERNRAVRSAWEASTLLRESADRVQLLGSRFSYPSLIEGHDGLAVHLRNPERILAHDESTITVTADCTLNEIWTHLRAHGSTLPICPPVITEQTIAGSIGTGTHAQGIGEGILADCVLAIDFVDATGRVRRVERGDDDFGAFQLHLGALGFITAVTLAVTANAHYACHKDTRTGADLISNFTSWVEQAAHVKAWWFVDQDRTHVWEVSPAAPGTTHRTPARFELNPVLKATQQRMGVDLNSDDRTIAPQRTVTRFYNYSDTQGDLVDIFRNGIPAPQVNMEVGVPMEHFAEAAADLAQVVTNSAYQLHYPVILRPTGPSEAWLAAAYDRATCWFGFVVYQRADGSVADGSHELLAEIQAVLAGHGGLPHWGKYFDPVHYDFDLLPRWRDFAEVRAHRDPSGRFLNPALARLLER